MERNRKNLLAKIHIGKTAMGWDEDTYRQILQSRYGAASAAALSDADLADMCEYLRSQGVKFRRPRKSHRSYYRIPDGTPYARQKRYICALWAKLGYPLATLDIRVKRQFGVAKLVWLHDEDDLQTLTKDLYTRCQRRGLDPRPW